MPDAAGGLITAVLGALMMPWKLIGSSSGFIFTWLVGYSALMGPVIGIMMADYFIIRRRQLSIDDLYSSSPAGAYWYKVSGQMALWPRCMVAAWQQFMSPLVP
jgi:NCS1 family nucleobase:cation symporter-1